MRSLCFKLSSSGTSNKTSLWPSSVAQVHDAICWIRLLLCSKPLAYMAVNLRSKFRHMFAGIDVSQRFSFTTFPCSLEHPRPQHDIWQIFGSTCSNGLWVRVKHWRLERIGEVVNWLTNWRFLGNFFSGFNLNVLAEIGLMLKLIEAFDNILPYILTFRWSNTFSQTFSTNLFTLKVQESRAPHPLRS
jgi:hypothetical protein